MRPRQTKVLHYFLYKNLFWKVPQGSQVRGMLVLGQTAQTRQKFNPKYSWNWLMIFVPATVWQILNMQCSTGNGSYLDMLILASKNSWNHCGWTYIWRVLFIWNSTPARFRSPPRLIARYRHTVVSNDKNPPKIKIKNWVKWLIIIMHPTVWKVLDMQMQSQETKIM